MSKKNNLHETGIGYSGILFIVFLVLKLTETINWSWWWISAPLWIPVVVVVLAAFVLVALSKITK